MQKEPQEIHREAEFGSEAEIFGEKFFQALFQANPDGFKMLLKVLFKFLIQHHTGGRSMYEKKKELDSLGQAEAIIINRHVRSVFGHFFSKKNPRGLAADELINHHVGQMSTFREEHWGTLVGTIFGRSTKDFAKVREEYEETGARAREVVRNLFNHKLEKNPGVKGKKKYWLEDPGRLGTKIPKDNELHNSGSYSPDEALPLMMNYPSADLLASRKIMHTSSPFETAVILVGDIAQDKRPKFDLLKVMEGARDIHADLIRICTEIIDANLLARFPKDRNVEIGFRKIEGSDEAKVCYKVKKTDKPERRLDHLCLELILSAQPRIGYGGEGNKRTAELVRDEWEPLSIEEFFEAVKSLGDDAEIRFKRADGNSVEMNDPTLIKLANWLMQNAPDSYLTRLLTKDGVALSTNLAGLRTIDCKKTAKGYRLSFIFIYSKIVIEVEESKRGEIDYVRGEIFASQAYQQGFFPQAEINIRKTARGEVVMDDRKHRTVAALESNFRMKLSLCEGWQAKKRELEITEDQETLFIDRAIHVLFDVYNILYDRHVLAKESKLISNKYLVQDVGAVLNRFSFAEFYGAPIAGRSAKSREADAAGGEDEFSLEEPEISSKLDKHKAAAALTLMAKSGSPTIKPDFNKLMKRKLEKPSARESNGRELLSLVVVKNRVDSIAHLLDDEVSVEDIGRRIAEIDESISDLNEIVYRKCCRDRISSLSSRGTSSDEVMHLLEALGLADLDLFFKGDPDGAGYRVILGRKLAAIIKNEIARFEDQLNLLERVGGTRDRTRILNEKDRRKAQNGLAGVTYLVKLWRVAEFFGARDLPKEDFDSFISRVNSFTEETPGFHRTQIIIDQKVAEVDVALREQKRNALMTPQLDQFKIDKYRHQLEVVRHLKELFAFEGEVGKKYIIEVADFYRENVGLMGNFADTLLATGSEVDYVGKLMETGIMVNSMVVRNLWIDRLLKHRTFKEDVNELGLHNKSNTPLGFVSRNYDLFYVLGLFGTPNRASDRVVAEEIFNRYPKLKEYIAEFIKSKKRHDLDEDRLNARDQLLAKEGLKAFYRGEVVSISKAV